MIIFHMHKGGVRIYFKTSVTKKRESKHLELEKPILEAFWCWLENLNVLNGSAIGKAVIYAKNQKKYMEN